MLLSLPQPGAPLKGVIMAATLTPAVLATRTVGAQTVELLRQYRSPLGWSVALERRSAVRHDMAGSYLASNLEVVRYERGCRPQSLGIYGCHQIANALNALEEARVAVRGLPV